MSVFIDKLASRELKGMAGGTHNSYIQLGKRHSEAAKMRMRLLVQQGQEEK